MTTLFLSAVRVKSVHGKRKTGKHVNVRKQINLTVTKNSGYIEKPKI